MKISYSLLIVWNLIITSLLIVSFTVENSWSQWETKGQLSVRELRVVDDDGNIIGIFGSTPNGPKLSMSFLESKSKVSLSQSNDGNIEFLIIGENGGKLEFRDKTSSASCSVGIDGEKTSFLSLAGSETLSEVKLIASSEKSRITLRHKGSDAINWKDDMSFAEMGCGEVGAYSSLFSKAGNESSILFRAQKISGSSFLLGSKASTCDPNETYSSSVIILANSNEESGVGISKISKNSNGESTHY